MAKQFSNTKLKVFEIVVVVKMSQTANDTHALAVLTLWQF
jgi:hypothetical protein